MSQPFQGMELLGRLSAGGMGEVLLARRRGAHGFEKLIALKTIRADLVRRDDIRRMFLDEARLMARLDHPAIAQVYDFGEENEVLYLAMEYVPGIVLSKLMKMRKSGIPPVIATRITIEVCRGLHAAHELADADGKLLGVVHRDVSPHNLMLTFDGRVKILDFGIAFRRGREAPETELGVVKGKVTYVAPEQLAGAQVDRRSDIYSVAVVLHEMLTGRKLFSGTGNPIVDAEERRTIPAPSKVIPSLPTALDDIVMKALAVDPQRRYQNAREMAIALEHAVPGLGVETVEEFAVRELAEERNSHRTRLSAITTGEKLQPHQPLPRTTSKSSLSIPITTGDVIGGNSTSRPETEDVPAGPPRTVEQRAHVNGGSSLSHTEEADVLPDPAEAPPRGGGRVVLLLLLAAVAITGVVALSSRNEPKTTLVQNPPPPATRLEGAKAVARELRTTLENVVDDHAQTATVAAATVADALAEVAERLYQAANEPRPGEVKMPVEGGEPNTERFSAVMEKEGQVQPATVAAAGAGEGEGKVEAEGEADTPPIPIKTDGKQTVPVRKIEPPSKRKAVVPVKQKFGFFTFEAKPNAVVVVDGKVVGYTPIRDYKITTGKHDVQLRKPHTRQLRLRRTIWVGEGKRIRVTVSE